MTTTTLAAPPLPAQAPSRELPRPVTHFVCGQCWPDILDPLARGACGDLANGPDTERHHCGWRGLGCGCRPCPACSLLDELPCAQCGDDS